jgi:SM-20-related protein
VLPDSIADDISRSAAGDELTVFACIAEQLACSSFCVLPDALPSQLADDLLIRIQTSDPAVFLPAGVGRSAEHTLNRFVRRDQILWIDGEGAAEQQWLAWSARLMTYLNRQLYLGLFSFESHFAHYQAGDFYRKHLDAFRPCGLERGARRVLSLVTYLNPGWQSHDGGELLIYDQTGESVVQRVLPLSRTVVVFLSTEVPHEVLPSIRDRYSIAGWFRRNGSVADRPDPPS